MRASSGLTVALAVTLTICFGTAAGAHRSEDYLQAARIDLEPDGVRITLDLTPGITVAESFAAALDPDGDGALSADEVRTYAERVVGALEVENDGWPLRPDLVSWSCPELAAFRRGEETIRLTLRASLPRLPAGPHRLFFKNAHLAHHGAYLANALVPQSSRVAVTAQIRASDQSELLIEYTVRPDSIATLAWGLGSLGAAVFLMARFRSFSLALWLKAQARTPDGPMRLGFKAARSCVRRNPEQLVNVAPGDLPTDVGRG